MIQFSDFSEYISNIVNLVIFDRPPNYGYILALKNHGMLPGTISRIPDGDSICYFFYVAKISHWLGTLYRFAFAISSPGAGCPSDKDDTRARGSAKSAASSFVSSGTPDYEVGTGTLHQRAFLIRARARFLIA